MTQLRNAVGSREKGKQRRYTKARGEFPAGRKKFPEMGCKTPKRGVGGGEA